MIYPLEWGGIVLEWLSHPVLFCKRQTKANMTYDQNWSGKDFYKDLGVTKAASNDEIKKAYRKMARKYHPDTNAGNVEAEAKFKGISEAYEVLSNSEKRKSYNDGPTADIFGGLFGGGGSGFSDKFDNLFNRRNSGRTNDSHAPDGFEDIFGNRNASASTPLNNDGGIDMEEMLNRLRENGTEGFRFTDGFTGRGKGASGTTGKPSSAPSGSSNASGKSSVTLSFEQAYKGGNVSLEIGGKQKTIKLPGGLRDNQTLQLKSLGVTLNVAVEPDEHFSWEGNKLVARVPISLEVSLKGGPVRLSFPDGKVIEVTLPARSENKSHNVGKHAVKDREVSIRPFIQLPTTVTPNQVNHILSALS